MDADLSTSFGEQTLQYTKFRPEYPDSVFAFIEASLGGELNLAVELGAGSGQATRRLATIFHHVIAVEPDARLVKPASFPSNVELQNINAEAATVTPGSVNLVTAATAFHWMDQPLICQHAAQWLQPRGVFFPFAYDVFQFEGNAQAFFLEEFEKWRPYRDARLDNNYNYADELKRTNVFTSVTRFEDQMSWDLSVQDAAGLICTASFANAYARAHSTPDAYFTIVEEALGKSGDKLRVTFPIIGALGRIG